MKHIDKIIQECIDRFVLNEKVGSKVYHFTSLENAYNILKNDTMYLQPSVGGGGADNYGGKMFYMSTTRNRNVNMSYASHYKNRQGGVRIEFNGDALNQRFKGLPMDYWGASMGKMSYMDGARSKSIDKVQSSNEMEDRVLSNQSTLPSVTKYINRIDVFALDEENMRLASIIKWKCGHHDIVYVYDNLKDFNYQTENTVEVEYPSNNNINRREVVHPHIIYEILGYFFTIYDLSQYPNPLNHQTVALELKKYHLEYYLNKSLFSAIQDAFHKCWGGPKEMVDRILDGLKNLSQSYPCDDSQNVMQLISDYMRKHKLGSRGSWVEYVNSFFNQKPQYQNVDTTKPIKVWAYQYEGKDSTTSYYNTPCSIDIDHDSFWDFIGRDDEEERMFFLENVFDKVKGEYDYDSGQYVNPTHHSKDNDSFYKYLQHLSKKNVPISYMLNFFHKLGIALNDYDVFNGKEIKEVKISFWDAPDNIREYFQK